MSRLAHVDLKERARRRVADQQPILEELNLWLHDNPETAYQEFRSSARLSEMLEGYGFTVEHPAYDLDTSFAARSGREGPELVICAEYDALPGIGHACGHNIIASSALGAGLALRPLTEELGFRVTVLGTPAEEGHGGKVDLINAGAFDTAAAAMMVHPSPRDVVDPTSLAVSHLEAAFHGKEAHASAFPEEGINALDGFVQSYVNISTLRQHILSTDKIHGIITDGGKAPNIIPALTRAKWYVRSSNYERLRVLEERVRSCFEAAALATGCRVEVRDYGHRYAELVHNPLLVELYAANSEALGRDPLRGAEMPPSEAGSTDMGNVSQIVPSIHPRVSLHCAPIGNHQPAFTSRTITPEGNRAIFDAAVGMAWTAIDLAAGNLWDRLGDS
ncbi:MAG: M20 family metallopeptidase [bacterium]|nr:M20 family metallopeptidase [bacterium]